MELEVSIRGHGRAIWRGVRELGEAGQAQNAQNTLTFAFAGFLTAIANFLFLEGILGTSLYPRRNFVLSYVFFNVVRSQVLNCTYDNSRRNPHTMFFIDLKYYFTCGESNLYKNVAKFQNIFFQDYRWVFEKYLILRL